MTTILKLHPKGQDTITFETLDAGNVLNGYYAPSSDYKFNESNRIDIIYSDTPFGGKAISEKQNLVPVNFSVYVLASSRDVMLELSQALNKALMHNPGGRLEYRPDGATISTYYKYEKSKPATVQEVNTNFWDGKTAENRKYVIAFSVELMTHPVATSGDPVSITPSRTTLRTSTYAPSSYNWFDLYDIKGDLPAIVNLSFNNTVGETISRLYLWSRSSRQSILNSLTLSYEATAATATGSWSTLTGDGNTTGGSYRRCEPADYTTWHQLGFTIPNEKEHRGFASIFVSLRSGFELDYVNLRLGYEVNGTRVWTSNTAYIPNRDLNGQWHIEYIGDIQLPPIGLSKDQEIPSPVLIVEVQQIDGDFIFDLDIDTVHIMFSDLSSLQIDVGNEFQTTGLASYEIGKLRSDEDLKRVGEIHSSSHVYRRPFGAMYGGPYGILAEDDTRIFVMFERVTQTGHLYHFPIALTIDTTIIYRTIFPFGSV